MNAYGRRLAALVASLTFVTLTSCETKPPPQAQTAATAKKAGESKQPSVEREPPAPTQASEAHPASKDDNADSDLTLRPNAKGFKTPQECFAVFAELKDSDDPQKDYDRYFGCLSIAKAQLETGSLIVELEFLGEQGDLDELAIEELFKASGLESYGYADTIRSAQRSGTPITKEVIDIGKMVTDKVAFARKASELKSRPEGPPNPGKRLSHRQLAQVDIDDNQAVVTLVDPDDPQADPGFAFFVFEDGSWRVAVPGHDWLARLSPDEEEAIEELSSVGSVDVDRGRRIAVQSFRVHRPGATAPQLAPLIMLPTIQEISIAGSIVVDEFAQRLTERDHLFKLNVADTNLSDAFLEHVKKFPKIQVFAVGSKISPEAAKKFMEDFPESQIILDASEVPAREPVAKPKASPKEFEPTRKFDTPEDCFRALCELQHQDNPDTVLLLDILSTANGKISVGKRIFDFESMWRQRQVDDQTARNLVRKHGILRFSMFDLLQVSDVPGGIGVVGAYLKAADLIADKPGYLRDSLEVIKEAERAAKGGSPAEEKPDSLSPTISDIEIDGTQAIATITVTTDQGELTKPIHFVLENGSWRVGLPRVDWAPMFNKVEKEVILNLRELGTVDVDFGARRLVSHFIVTRKGIDEAALAPMNTITSWLEVNLQDSNVTDAFIEKLAASPALRAIGLRGTNISDKSLEHLSSLKHLKKMDLTNTNISSDALNQFREEHPDCQIATGWQIEISSYLATASSQRPKGDAVVLMVGDGSCIIATVTASKTLRTRSIFQATRNHDAYIGTCIVSTSESERPKSMFPKDLPAIAIWKRDADAPEFLPSSTTPDQVAEAIEKMAKPLELGGDKPEN